MDKDKAKGLTEKELDVLLDKDDTGLTDEDLEEIAGGKSKTPANSSEKTIKETVKKLKQLV